jgi:hypothetical protein
MSTLARTSRIAAILSIVALFALVGCGRADGATTVEGFLRAGDADFWLVDGTLVAIGGARITGEPSQVGARINARGHLAPDGILEAETITVGKVDPAKAASSLADAEVSGPVEVLDATTGHWQVRGRSILVPDGVAAPRAVAIGTLVTIRGYALPNGDLLAAEISATTQAPTAAPTATTIPGPPPAVVPTQAPTATPVPAPPVASPAPRPVNPPKPTSPPKPPKGDDDDGKGKDKGKP